MSTCPVCGAEREPDASFCEGCGHDFTGTASPAPVPPGSPGAASAAQAGGLVTGAGETQTRVTPVRAHTAEAGEESPLDVGWTGPVSSAGAALAVDPVSDTCRQCGAGHFLDGYCDMCGAKAPDPRDHFAESPADWLAGVCDLGSRKRRNEDAMALLASARPLDQGVLVVCDGVSNSVDSHIASLAAARAAREVLDDPVPHAMGLPEAVVAAIEKRLAEAVVAARAAVIETTADPTGETPPSCTFVAALVADGLAVVGNVGDSRAYWLPDAPASAAVQLGEDDSFAEEQIRDGMPRKEAETGAQAHAITRWLGVDSPEDLTPHTASIQLGEDGWLLLCSDGLWNYCSEPADLRALVATTVAGLGAHGRNPATLAQALVDFANAAGGQDNITVALVRVGPTDPPATAAPPAPPAQAPAPGSDLPPVSPDVASTAPPPPTPPSPPTPPTPPTPPGEVAHDGTVHD